MFAIHGNVTQPRWLKIIIGYVPRVAAFAATLGFMTQPRWGKKLIFTFSLTAIGFIPAQHGMATMAENIIKAIEQHLHKRRGALSVSVKGNINELFVLYN